MVEGALEGDDMTNESGISILATRHGRLHIALQVSLVLAVATFLFEIAELVGIFSPNGDPEAAISVIDGLYLLVAFAMVAVAIITIILWCMWLHRAARNIVESDLTQFAFTPGWAVGWHFIPIANLFKPFEVMREIWNASVGEMHALDLSAPLVTRWWAAWLVTSIIGNISLRISLQAETAEGLYWGTALGAISSIANLIAIPVAMKMLAAITEGQRSRF
jgi:hypothetical protein